MDLDFSLGPLHITARYRPAIPDRRVGHPDRWTEGEPEEIEILSVAGSGCDEVADDDLDDAVRIEASRRLADRMDAWIARQEESGW